MPGFVEDLNCHGGDIEAVSGKLVEEARKKLETRANMAEMKDDLRMHSTLEAKSDMSQINEYTGDSGIGSLARPPRRRVRIVSTPAGKGHDMFGEVPPAAPVFQPSAPVRARGRRQRTVSTPISGDMFGDTAAVVLAPGEVLLNIVEAHGNKIPIKVHQDLYKKMKESNIPLSLSEVTKETNFVGTYLDGFVRKEGRSRTLSSLSGMKE